MKKHGEHPNPNAPTGLQNTRVPPMNVPPSDPNSPTHRPNVTGQPNIPVLFGCLSGGVFQVSPGSLSPEKPNQATWHGTGRKPDQAKPWRPAVAGGSRAHGRACIPNRGPATHPGGPKWQRTPAAGGLQPGGALRKGGKRDQQCGHRGQVTRKTRTGWEGHEDCVQIKLVKLSLFEAIQLEEFHAFIYHTFME